MRKCSGSWEIVHSDFFISSSARKTQKDWLRCCKFTLLNIIPRRDMFVNWISRPGLNSSNTMICEEKGGGVAMRFKFWLVARQRPNEVDWDEGGVGGTLPHLIQDEARVLEGKKSPGDLYSSSVPDSFHWWILHLLSIPEKDWNEGFKTWVLDVMTLEWRHTQFINTSYHSHRYT